MNMYRLAFFLILLPALSFSAADNLSALLARANQLWQEEKFISFAETCKEIHVIQQTFPSTYNAALGYYRGGDVDKSLSQIANIKDHLALSTVESRLLAALEKKANDYRMEIASIRKTHTTKGGGATLSKQHNFSDAGDSCGRHANCQRLKPDQIQDYMKEVSRRDSIAAGHMVPPDDGDSSIDPLAM